MSIKFPSVYLYPQGNLAASPVSKPLHFTGGPTPQDTEEEGNNSPKKLLPTLSLPLPTDEFKKAHPSRLPSITKRHTTDLTTTPARTTATSIPVKKTPKTSLVPSSSRQGLLKPTTRSTTSSVRKASTPTSTALVRTSRAKQNDNTSSASVTSIPREETTNNPSGTLVSIPHYSPDGKVTYTQTRYSPQQILDLYGIYCYSDPEPETENTIAASLQKHFQSKSRELARTLDRTYNPNILLLSQDPKFKKPMLLALQKELGYKIPVVNFNKKNLEAYDRRFSPFLETLISYNYDALRERAGLTPEQPLVLFLKNASIHTIDLLADNPDAKQLFENRNLRLIVDTTPKALAPPNVIRIGHRDNDSSDSDSEIERPSSRKMELQNFTPFRLKNLDVHAWAEFLEHSKEMKAIQQKYGFALTQKQRLQLLQAVLQKNPDKLTQKMILQTLESVGVFMNSKDTKNKLTENAEQSISDSDFRDFLRHASLLNLPEGAITTQLSFELDPKSDMANVIGLEEPKEAIHSFSKRVLETEKYPHLALDLPVVKTMLLQGESGTGKTMLAEATARGLEELTGSPVTFINANPSKFTDSGKYGKGTKFVNSVFEMIDNVKTKAAVVFFDEIDDLYNRANRGGGGGGASVAHDMGTATSTFLKRLQTLKNTAKKPILVISTTNNAAYLDQAFMDRQDHVFAINKGDIKQNKQLLQKLFDKYELAYSPEFIHNTALKLQNTAYNLSRRQFESFVRQVRDEAFDTASNNSQRNEEAATQGRPKLKVTEEVVEKVLRRFKSNNSAFDYTV